GGVGVTGDVSNEGTVTRGSIVTADGVIKESGHSNRNVAVARSVIKKRLRANCSIATALGIVKERLIAKATVAWTAGGIAKRLKTDRSAKTKLLQTDGPGDKTVKRLIPQRGVGTGDG